MSDTLETKNQILAMLKKEKMTATELGNQLNLSKQTISQHIHELENMGLIEESDNHFFKRLKYYQLKSESGNRNLGFNTKVLIGIFTFMVVAGGVVIFTAVKPPVYLKLSVLSNNTIVIPTNSSASIGFVLWSPTTRNLSVGAGYEIYPNKGSYLGNITYSYLSKNGAAVLVSNGGNNTWAGNIIISTKCCTLLNHKNATWYVSNLPVLPGTYNFTVAMGARGAGNSSESASVTNSIYRIITVIVPGNITDVNPDPGLYFTNPNYTITLHQGQNETLMYNLTSIEPWLPLAIGGNVTIIDTVTNATFTGPYRDTDIHITAVEGQGTGVWGAGQGLRNFDGYQCACTVHVGSNAVSGTYTLRVEGYSGYNLPSGQFLTINRTRSKLTVTVLPK